MVSPKETLSILPQPTGLAASDADFQLSHRCAPTRL
jgi:hypothetical protein